MQEKLEKNLLKEIFLHFEKPVKRGFLHFEKTPSELSWGFHFEYSQGWICWPC